MFEEPVPTGESMTPLIATATTCDNLPLIEEHDAATTLVANTLSDTAESTPSILSAQRKARNPKKAGDSKEESTGGKIARCLFLDCIGMNGNSEVSVKLVRTHSAKTS